ncbi:MAG: hypothetical protein ACOYJU_05845 [Anaerovoracaceae bacterium]
MTPFEIGGIIALLAVLFIGIILKCYTRKKLKDMDGVGGPSVTTKKDADHIVHVEQRP